MKTLKKIIKNEKNLLLNHSTVVRLFAIAKISYLTDLL